LSAKDGDVVLGVVQVEHVGAVVPDGEPESGGLGAAVVVPERGELGVLVPQVAGSPST
jgi:hypothetical protein